jgi:hypothetical protein
MHARPKKQWHARVLARTTRTRDLTCKHEPHEVPTMLSTNRQEPQNLENTLGMNRHELGIFACFSHMLAV